MSPVPFSWYYHLTNSVDTVARICNSVGGGVLFDTPPRCRCWWRVQYAPCIAGQSSVPFPSPKSAPHGWTIVLTELREWGSGRAGRGRVGGVTNSACIHVSHGIKRSGIYMTVMTIAARCPAEYWGAVFRKQCPERLPRTLLNTAVAVLARW